MKKALTGILAFTMIFTMMLGLVSCGGDSPKKKEATDAFNTTSTSFNEVANMINENTDAVSEDIITVFQDMSALLTQYKDLLEGDTELTDEQYDEMITWFGTAQDWFDQVKTQIETNLGAAAE